MTEREFKVGDRVRRIQTGEEFTVTDVVGASHSDYGDYFVMGDKNDWGTWPRYLTHVQEEAEDLSYLITPESKLSAISAILNGDAVIFGANLPKGVPHVTALNPGGTVVVVGNFIGGEMHIQ